MNNGMPPDYGFNVPEQERLPPGPGALPPSYGYGQPPQPYTPTSTRNYSFAGTGQFASQLLAQPVVANVAMQYGSELANVGKQQLEKYVPVTALKYYFAVDTDYVLMKLILLFFPFTHKVNQFMFCTFKDLYPF